MKWNAFLPQLRGLVSMLLFMVAAMFSPMMLASDAAPGLSHVVSFGDLTTQVAGTSDHAPAVLEKVTVSKQLTLSASAPDSRADSVVTGCDSCHVENPQAATVMSWRAIGAGCCDASASYQLSWYQPRSPPGW